MQGELRKSVIITKDCWDKLKEISTKEKFHMYEIVEALVNQYYTQINYENRK